MMQMKSNRAPTARQLGFQKIKSRRKHFFEAKFVFTANEIGFIFAGMNTVGEIEATFPPADLSLFRSISSASSETSVVF